MHLDKIQTVNYKKRSDVLAKLVRHEGYVFWAC